MIQITDNFFEDISEAHKKFKDASVPMLDPTDQDGWQGSRSNEFDDVPELKEYVIQNIERAFNLNRKDYSKIEIVLHYRKDLKVNIHQDDSDLNVLIFFEGEHNIYNGTGFYHKTPEAEILDLSVGFKQNRAICFSPKTPHASLTGLNTTLSSPRWTINSFLYK